MGFEDNYGLSMGLLTFNLVVIGLVFAVAAWSLLKAVTVRQIRLVANKGMPTLTLKKEHKFHTFLSHSADSTTSQLTPLVAPLLAAIAPAALTPATFSTSQYGQPAKISAVVSRDSSSCCCPACSASLMVPGPQHLNSPRHLHHT